MKRSFDEVNKIVGKLQAVEFYFLGRVKGIPTNEMNHVKQLLTSNQEAWRGEMNSKLSVCFVTGWDSNHEDGKILTQMSEELNDQFKQLGMASARNGGQIAEVKFGIYSDKYDEPMIEFFNRHNI